MSLLPQKRDMAIRHARLSVPAIASLGAVFTAVICGSPARARQRVCPLAAYRVRSDPAGVRRKMAGHGADQARKHYAAETLDHMLADTAMTGPGRQFPRYRRSALINGPATAPASPGSRPRPGYEATDSMSAWPATLPATRRVAGPRQGASLGRRHLRTVAVLPGN
jgi:hypothetical protein